MIVQAGWLKNQGSIPNGGKIFFSFLQLWGPRSLLSIVFQGVKWPGHEADHSPLSSAEVKNAWSYTSLPYDFMMRCLII
jgi:hypothetical protein